MIRVAIADDQAMVRAGFRMIVASQWTYAHAWQRALVVPPTRFVIRRLARAYSFVTIEPAGLGAM